tara:strand:+ start:510 stop:1190 length:681 start_codon:yes stop_codon:yes gene_type:complete
MKANEKGFALVLSLVLMLAMSLMGGALIVISAGDHKSNNRNEDYQQVFYVAETALFEGEKYLYNQFMGPWNTSTHKRNTSARGLPANKTSVYTGGMTAKNYTQNSVGKENYLLPGPLCYNSYRDIDRGDLKVVISESWNFGVVLKDSFRFATNDEKDEVDKLKKYYYQYFITRIGSAPYRGSGSSVKKGANNTGNDGMAYRVYGCGIKHGSDPTVVALESVVVLPK